MNPFLLLSRIGIRPRILGGFALILSFLVSFPAPHSFRSDRSVARSMNT